MVIAWFFVLPIWRLLRLSAGTEGIAFGAYSEVLASRTTWEVVRTTLGIAGAATAIATVAGVALAWLIAYTDVPGKRAIQILILLPFVLPSYVVALAWVRTFGRNGPLGFLDVNLYTRAGIVFVLALTTAPIVYLLVVAVLRSIPSEIEHAARASGAGPVAAAVRVTLPAALPGIAGGGLLAFLSCLDNFGVPAFLGTPANIQVLSTAIYQQVIGFGPAAFTRAAVLALLLGAIALAGTALQWFLLRRGGVNVDVRMDAPPRVFLGRARSAVAVAVGGGAAVLSFVPLYAMVRSSLSSAVGVTATWDTLTLRHYEFLLHSSSVRTALAVSARLTVLTVAVCLVLGTFVAYTRLRYPSPLTKIVDVAVAVPFALPGVVVALAAIFAWVQPFPGVYPGIYGTWLILLVAYVTRFAYFQVRASAAGLAALDPATIEAARACGAGAGTAWRRVVLPLLSGSLLAGAFLIAVNAMSELTVSAILYSAGSQTVGVVVMGFERAGSAPLAAALSTLLLIAYGVMGLLVLICARYLNPGRSRGH
ncbi:iron ABC transporter permease [Hoyosella sp. YIM 151337]|uniref:ABC transporter permease n=1 Tax=Hoyosella sp. YIM 151337 TaxID=2992742 RepID=UPI0022369A78|nr:iron ABC transporter permease [Hoyosella sp. YIM 151337]MCW4354345.1 iron ABC transporter permease [Hoyosella sp. YIM 151337]